MKIRNHKDDEVKVLNYINHAIVNLYLLGVKGKSIWPIIFWRVKCYVRCTIWYKVFTNPRRMVWHTEINHNRKSMEINGTGGKMHQNIVASLFNWFKGQLIWFEEK